MWREISLTAGSELEFLLKKLYTLCLVFHLTGANMAAVVTHHFDLNILMFAEPEWKNFHLLFHCNYNYIKLDMLMFVRHTFPVHRDTAHIVNEPSPTANCPAGKGLASEARQFRRIFS